MANVTESANWEAGVYRIETTDPILGGENGTANIQAKQLANRTAYLKVRADQVDAAAAGYPDLGSRMDKIEADAASLGPDMQNMVDGALMFALDQAAQADWGVRALREQWQQEGELVMRNRGIVSGCAPVKNANDVTIGDGVCFAGGMRHVAVGGTFAVPVSTSETLVHHFYLRPSGNGYAAQIVTGDAPDDGILVCTITVPPNVTDLSTATMVDERRIEPDFPALIDAPVEEYVAINTLSAGDWRFDVDVVSAAGAPVSRDAVALASRAGNGMTVRLLSAADDVVVRWRVSKLNN